MPVALKGRYSIWDAIFSDDSEPAYVPPLPRGELPPSPVAGYSDPMARTTDRQFITPESGAAVDSALYRLAQIGQKYGDALDIMEVAQPLMFMPVARIAYHGSPYKFDRFSKARIGTGEGAQAYGRGLYFAEHPEVARSYAPTRHAIDLADDGFSEIEHQLLKKMDGLLEAGRYDEYGAIEHLLTARDPAGAMELYGHNPAARKIIEEYADKFVPGYLYKVDIPDEVIPRMLDWDTPIRTQPDEVIDAVARAMAEQATGGEVTEDLLRTLRRELEQSYETGGEIYQRLAQAGDEWASDALLRHGVPGVKYFDQFSRKAGDGTRNFVVFDDSLVKLLERTEK